MKNKEKIENNFNNNLKKNDGISDLVALNIAIREKGYSKRDIKWALKKLVSKDDVD
jgi:hypothetical protein